MDFDVYVLLICSKDVFFDVSATSFRYLEVNAKKVLTCVSSAFRVEELIFESRMSGCDFIRISHILVEAKSPILHHHNVKGHSHVLY